MLYFITSDTMSQRNIISISLQCPSWMSTFDEFCLQFAKFIFVNKILTKGDESRSISPTKLLRYLLIGAVAVTLAAMVLTTPPLLLNVERHFCIFDPSHPKARTCQLVECTRAYFEMSQVLPGYCIARNTFS